MSWLIHGHKYRSTMLLPAWVVIAFTLILDGVFCSDGDSNPAPESDEHQQNSYTGGVFCADVDGEQTSTLNLNPASVVLEQGLFSADFIMNWWAFPIVDVQAEDIFAIRNWMLERHEHMLNRDFAQMARDSPRRGRIRHVEEKFGEQNFRVLTLALGADALAKAIL